MSHIFKNTKIEEDVISVESVKIIFLIVYQINVKIYLEAALLLYIAMDVLQIII